MEDWVEQEVKEADFPDQRLKSRLGKLLSELGRRIGATTACQDWAATKAAYRFFSNNRVDENMILAGHFAATKARFDQSQGPILVLHDTTEFTFKREKPETIGQTHRLTLSGQYGPYTVCGMLMHSSLVVTPEGVPLGLAAAKFWTRKKFKGTNALKKKVNPTRIPIEQKESFRWLENLKQSTTLLADSPRCVHIGDRESDIYELFCEAVKAETKILVRTCVDRLAGQGQTTISKKMHREVIRGTHTIEVQDQNGRVSTAQLHLRFCRMTVHPPIGKKRQYPPLSLTVIHAKERGIPEGRDPIHWKLLTNLPVEDLPTAIEKLDWYAQRWKIETFHKVIKSGCKAEESKLRTADRLTNLIAVLCIIAWRVFWLTMVNCADPEALGEVALTKTEMEILDHLSGSLKPKSKRTITDYLTEIAKLGGYLARGKDPPPGNMVLWRGLTRLTDIHLGFEMKNRFVGN